MDKDDLKTDIRSGGLVNDVKDKTVKSSQQEQFQVAEDNPYWKLKLKLLNKNMNHVPNTKSGSPAESIETKESKFYDLAETGNSQPENIPTKNEVTEAESLVVSDKGTSDSDSVALSKLPSIAELYSMKKAAIQAKKSYVSSNIKASSQLKKATKELPKETQTSTASSIISLSSTESSVITSSAVAAEFAEALKLRFSLFYDAQDFRLHDPCGGGNVLTTLVAAGRSPAFNTVPAIEFPFNDVMKHTYARNNRSDGCKGLQCFPECTKQHNLHQFCGTVLPILVTFPLSWLNNSNKSSIYRVIGEFVEVEVDKPATIFNAKALNENLKHAGNVLGKYYPGKIEGKRQTPSGIMYLFQFNAELVAWHYGFRSNKYKIKCMHSFRVYILAKSPDGESYSVVMTQDSRLFTVVSTRLITIVGQEGRVKKKNVKDLLQSNSNEPSKPSKQAPVPEQPTEQPDIFSFLGTLATAAVIVDRQTFVEVGKNSELKNRKSVVRNGDKPIGREVILNDIMTQIASKSVTNVRKHMKAYYNGDDESNNKRSIGQLPSAINKQTKRPSKKKTEVAGAAEKGKDSLLVKTKQTGKRSQIDQQGAKVSKAVKKQKNVNVPKIVEASLKRPQEQEEGKQAPSSDSKRKKEVKENKSTTIPTTNDLNIKATSSQVVTTNDSKIAMFESKGEDNETDNKTATTPTSPQRQRSKSF